MQLGRVGSSRSAVRAIGASLPWTPVRTPSLNIPQSDGGSERSRTCKRTEAGRRRSVGNSCHIASFADVGWVHADEYDEKEDVEVDIDELEQVDEQSFVAAADEECPAIATPEAAETPSDPNAMAKISALEVELASLRAQLALVVKNQEGVASAVPQPCASAAAATPPCSAVAPPPPPPPPPPCLIVPEPVNVIDLIRKKRAERDGRPVGDSAKDEKMDMSQVIKQMGMVKLRSVQRSPGGTPIRQKPRSDANDPATIIANALQRKFAKTNVVVDEDSDTENTPSPKRRAPRRIVSPRRRLSKSSPVGKLAFGQHMLRSHGAPKRA